MNSDPALLAALQLLTQKITGLPGEIIAANADYTERSGGSGVERVYVTNENWAAPVPVQIAGRSGDGAGEAAGKDKSSGLFGGLKSAGAMLALKFAAIAGPAAIIGAVLSSSTSGFQTLGTAVKVLASTIAPVLLPATMLLSTALVALSDVLSATLMPGMEGFIGLILSSGIPVLVTFIGAVQVIAQALADLAKWAEDKFGEKQDENGERITDPRASSPDSNWYDFNWDVIPDPKRNTQAYWRLYDEELKKLEDTNWEDPDGPWYRTKGADRREKASQLADARYAAGERGKPSTDTNSPRDLVLNALRDVVKSFSLSAGPKAQISGLEGVGKAAQLAALNQDPLEARMLRTQQQILRMLERAVASLGGGGGVYTPGDGKFTTGTGGDFGGSF